jgi:L-ribulose-5-phosphate 3-epimerase
MTGARRFGIYEKALPGGSWPTILDAATAAGYDFIEISIDESEDRLSRLEWTKGERSALANQCRDRDVPIFSICLSAHRRYGLGSADDAVREKAAEILDKAIGLAADLGVRVIQIAGYHAYYESPSTSARERYIDGLHDGTRLASQRGVMLAIENIDTVDTASVGDALRVRDELASPWFQIYPDVGNLAVHRLDVAAETRLMAGSAVGVHLKDARPGEPRRVPFGSGTVPFTKVFAALAGTNYDGPFTVEMWNDDPDTAVQLAAAALVWLRRTIAASESASHLTGWSA